MLFNFIIKKYILQAGTKFAYKVFEVFNRQSLCIYIFHFSSSHFHNRCVHSFFMADIRFFSMNYKHIFPKNRSLKKCRKTLRRLYEKSVVQFK